MDLYLLRAVSVELQQRLEHAAVLAPRQVDPYRFILPFRAADGGLQLLVSIDPTDPRVHLVEQDYPCIEDGPFLQTVHRHFRDMVFVNCAVPLHDRVLRLDLASRFSPGRRFALVLELTGRRCNAVLLDALDDDRIIFPYKHVTLDRSIRPLLPGFTYPPLPARQAANLLESNSEEIAGILQALAPPLDWRRLVDAFTPLSRHGAEAALSRADTENMALALSLQQVASEYAAGQFVPRTVTSGDGRARAEVIARLEPPGATVNGHLSVSAAVEEAFAGQQRATALSALRGKWLNSVRRHELRIKKALAACAVDISNMEDRIAGQRHGELLLTWLQDVPKAVAEVTLDDPVSGENVRITLDPRMSAVKNAERLFLRAKKGRRGIEEAHRRRSDLERELADIRTWQANITGCATADELETIGRQLEMIGLAGNRTVRRDKPAAKAPVVLMSPDGFRIIAGKNAKENDLVTFRTASPWDFWFHVQTGPGGHVIALNPERLAELPPATVRYAAEIAAGLSKRRREQKILIVYTARKHVRRIPGAAQGMVTYTNETTILVKPRVIR